MSGPSRSYKYRFRVRPGKDRQYRLVIQRRRWWGGWQDWIPVENEVRSLQIEFIECYDRMMDILEELKTAQEWEKQAFAAVELGHKAKGISSVFEGPVRKREDIMTDMSTRFDEVKKLVQQGQGRQRPDHRGTRSVYLGAVSKRFDPSHLNRTAVGEDYNADHVIQYRPPHDDRSQKSKQQNNKQGQQNQGHKD